MKQASARALVEISALAIVQGSLVCSGQTKPERHSALRMNSDLAQFRHNLESKSVPMSKY